MARTKHQIVRKAAIAGAAHRAGKRKGAKNSDLKQAAHQGRAPVTDPRNAQPGFAAVPVSTATLPPGEGPPMSSTPTPAGRGRNSRRSASSARASGATQALLNQNSASPVRGASDVASPPGRARRRRAKR